MHRSADVLVLLVHKDFCALLGIKEQRPYFSDILTVNISLALGLCEYLARSEQLHGKSEAGMAADVPDECQGLGGQLDALGGGADCEDLYDILDVVGQGLDYQQAV